MLATFRRLNFFAIVALGLVGPAQAQVTPAAESSAEQTTPAEPGPEIDPELKEKLSSAARTLETFLTALNEDRKADAAQCLDLSEVLTEEAKQAKGPVYAYRLKEVIDRLWLVDLSEVEYWSQPELFRFDFTVRDDAAMGDAALIAIAPDENGLWRFTADTVASIETLYEEWKDKPKVDLLSTSNTSRPPEIWLSDQFPNHQETHFLIKDYKWICLVILVLVGFAADFLTRGLLNGITRIWFRYRGQDYPEQRRIWKPVGLLVQVLVWYYGTKVIDLPSPAPAILLVGLKALTVFAGVWTIFRLIDLLGAIAAKRTQRTATRFDDLLVPLITKLLKVIVVCNGVIICAKAIGFELPVGLLGTLGLGGVAFALASQDAISNVFGSITVLMDRPFEMGDWVIVEDIEGSVETVGFRSTRIRTFYNSLVTVPNSRLTTAVVDNMGRRRFRRIRATLGLEYDTSPERIDAFCEGVRELLRRHPYTRKDYYHVYFHGFGASSLDILLYCFLECPDWSVELRERHRLFLDILRLADSLQVSFAFPTRTLHMISEQNGVMPEPVGDPERAGQVAAARLAGPERREPLGPVRFEGPALIDDGGLVDDDGGE